MTTITSSPRERLLGRAADVSAPLPAQGHTTLAARLLGELSVVLDGRPVPVGSSRRTRALLAYLVDHGHRPVPRDALMELFWPSSSPSAARNSLHVAVHGVRKALAAAWPGEVVECRGDIYRLSDQVDLWTDVAELERRCAQAAALATQGRVAEAIADYEAALALCGGEFLADDPYLDWALARREEVRLLAVTCAERTSELLFAAGDLDRAAAAATALLRTEPCHEPVARRLMLSYARLGQPHRALREYDRIVTVLDRHLGVRPALETLRLAEAIRRREPL